MKDVHSISTRVQRGDSEMERLFESSPIQVVALRRGTSGYASSTIDKVVISPLGRLVNGFYNTLNGIVDPQERSLALCGLDYSVRQLLHNPCNIHMLGFMNVLYRSNQSDIGFFCTLLKTFGALVYSGYDLAEWLEVCSGAKDRAALRTFVEETCDIIETGEEIPASARDTFRFFLSIWKTRLSSECMSRIENKRRYLRKRMRLSGYYHRLPTLLGSEIVVRDLSPGGFSFEVLGRHPPKEDELIQVFFVLDDYVKKGVNKLALVKRWDGRLGGAQFYG